MSGGLGNQMFQYALYLAFQAEGRQVRIDQSTEYGEHEKQRHPELMEDFGPQLASYEIASRAEIVELTDSYMDFFSRVRRKLTGRRTKLYAEKAPYVYDPEVLHLTDAYLAGCWQSEKYFATVKREVRGAFSMENVKLTGRRREFEEMILGLRSAEDAVRTPDQAGPVHAQDASAAMRGDAAAFMTSAGEGAELRTVPVSVHVRRGDYLCREDIYGGICTEEYYRRARACLEEKLAGRGERPHYFLFTNDPVWAEKNYGGSGVTVVEDDGNPDSRGIEDMKLMSLCRHHIIANSSFSWWGSWLSEESGRIVMAPPRFINTSDGTDMLRDDMTVICGDS